MIAIQLFCTESHRNSSCTCMITKLVTIHVAMSNKNLQN